MDISDFISEAPTTNRLGALPGYLYEPALISPIDEFYTSLTNIVNFGNQDTLAANDFLGGLLVIGVVSAGEFYFRRLASSCMEMCPLAQSKSASLNISLGGALWHSRSGFSKGAFEHLSLASKDEVCSLFLKYIGIDFKRPTFQQPLDEYEKVCQLRHGLVHSDGHLPGKNAVVLGVPKTNRNVKIRVRYEQLQEAASVVNTLVATVNRYTFHTFCQRWAVDWRRRSDWAPEDEYKLFSEIWQLFHSKIDAVRRRGGGAYTRKKCLLAVRQEFRLSE